MQARYQRVCCVEGIEFAFTVAQVPWSDTARLWQKALQLVREQGDIHGANSHRESGRPTWLRQIAQEPPASLIKELQLYSIIESGS